MCRKNDCLTFRRYNLRGTNTKGIWGILRGNSGGPSGVLFIREKKFENALFR